MNKYNQLTSVLASLWLAASCGGLGVEAPGVLSNDVAGDGGEFLATLVTDPSHGDVALQTDAEALRASLRLKRS